MILQGYVKGGQIFVQTEDGDAAVNLPPVAAAKLREANLADESVAEREPIDPGMAEDADVEKHAAGKFHADVALRRRWGCYSDDKSSADYQAALQRCAAAEVRWARDRAAGKHGVVKK